MMEKKIPNTLDEAIEILMEDNKEHIEGIKKQSKEGFIGMHHHGAGTNMRNSWHLWWSEDSSMGWPKEKPKLVEFFNNLGIYHADDMSGIIMESFHRTVAGKPIELEKQVEKYKKFWKKEGYKDGMYKPK